MKCRHQFFDFYWSFINCIPHRKTAFLKDVKQKETVWENGSATHHLRKERFLCTINLVRAVNEAVHRLDDQIFREAFTPKFLKNMRESGLSLDSFLCSKYRAFPVQLKHVEDQEALHYMLHGKIRNGSTSEAFATFLSSTQKDDRFWISLLCP